MDYNGDVVSDLQHSLMNAHGLVRKIKAINRQLNASHTILVMKQSTGNEQLAKHVQDIRENLEAFHEEMMHQLTKSFQEKTTYLSTCMQQLKHEETTIGQLCRETENLLKQCTTTISPVQVQRGKTLMEAFKIMSREHSADMEFDEDVIHLDFIPLKPVEDYITFGNIQVRQNDNSVKADEVKQTDKSRQTLSRSSQTEILFKDYCPFCGRTYSKGKKDVDVQACVLGVDCASQSDVVESDTFWQNKCYKGEKLAMDCIDEQRISKKLYMGSTKSGQAPVSLIHNPLIDLSKYPSSDESTTSKSSASKAYNGVGSKYEDAHVAERRRKPMTGKKLKNLNFQHLEEVWNSSDDDEMEEATRSLSNPLTFAAAVKRQEECDQQKGEIKRSMMPSVPAVTDKSSKNYIPPPPPGFSLEQMNGPFVKEKIRTKKPMLAAKSKSMLTGLVENAKAQNIIHPPHVNRTEVQINSDWRRVAPEVPKVQPQISPIQLPKASVVTEKNGEIVVGVTDCWNDEEEDSVSRNSVTSTPKIKMASVASRFNGQPAVDENEEFQLRRPSVSFITSPRVPKVCSKTDDNNNSDNMHLVTVKTEPIIRTVNVEGNQSESLGGVDSVKTEVKNESMEIDIKIKSEPDCSSIVDSGWEEDSGVSEYKESAKDSSNWIETPQKRETTTYVKGSEIWTKTIKIEATSLSKCQNVFKKEKGYRARDDWEPKMDADTGKNLIYSVKDSTTNSVSQSAKCHGANDNDWETKSKLAVRKPKVTRWDMPPHEQLVITNSGDARKVVLAYNKAVAGASINFTPALSPVASYIEKMSKGTVSKILPPLPAKLTMKIGDGLCFPIGVATTSKGDIVVADTGNHFVKIFTSGGRLRLSVGKMLKPAMQRPSAIVVNKKDEIFVKDDLCIRVFETVEGRLLRQMGINHLTMPYGLSWTPEGHLLTLDVDKRNPRIVIFSQNGDLINTFPYIPLQGRIPQTRCRFLDVSQNTLIVSDLGRHEIYVTDLKGKLKTYFGRGGYGNGEFHEPSGVVVDTSGYMMIADSKNDRIQIFRPDGGFVCIVAFSEPIKRPSDIHLTSDGHLIVVNFLNHQLKIYKLGDSGVQ